MDRAVETLRLAKVTLGLDYLPAPLIRAVAAIAGVPADVLAARVGYRLGRAKAPGRPYAIGPKREANIVVSPEAMEVLGDR